MLSKNVIFKGFINKTNNKYVFKLYNNLKKDFLSNKLKPLNSLSNDYKYSYNNKIIKKLKKFQYYRIIGVGGSILGSKAIYQFLNNKIKKIFFFIDNLEAKLNLNKKKIANLIISKSGNTLETISNSNVLLKNNKNIFIVEKNNNYLNNLANKIKADVIEHKNYIGGRYSVLSEVGMLPAQLMGLDERKFKRLNYLIKNKTFTNNLISNVSSTLNLLKKNKYLSVILNYDRNSEDLIFWYQQLIAESLGKKSKGILPLVSRMPKDNHSLMQFYLDGPKKNFYTFFDVFEKNSNKIKNDYNNKTFQKLKNKSIYDIVSSQKAATMKVFSKKQLPFRNFHILKRDEQSIGELFCFFILETILLGKALKVNPFDQPSVELIKIETKKILL